MACEKCGAEHSIVKLYVALGHVELCAPDHRSLAAFLSDVYPRFVYSSHEAAKNWLEWVRFDGLSSTGLSGSSGDGEELYNTFRDFEITGRAILKEWLNDKG